MKWFENSIEYEKAHLIWFEKARLIWFEKARWMGLKKAHLIWLSRVWGKAMELMEVR